MNTQQLHALIFVVAFVLLIVSSMLMRRLSAKKFAHLRTGDDVSENFCMVMAAIGMIAGCSLTAWSAIILFR